MAYSPVFTPKSGTYTTPQSVTLVSDTAGARARSNGGGFRGLISTSKPGTNDYVSGFNLDLGGKASADAITSLNAEGAGFSGELNLLPEAVPFGKTFSASAIIGVEKVSAFVGAVPRTGREFGAATLVPARSREMDRFRYESHHRPRRDEPSLADFFRHRTERRGG